MDRPIKLALGGLVLIPSFVFDSVLVFAGRSVRTPLGRSVNEELYAVFGCLR